MTHYRKARGGLWATLAACALVLPGASGNPAYHISGISALGAANSTPYAINNGGTIVGSVTTATGGLNATFWREDAYVNLNRPDILGSVGYAVNNAGSIAGIVFTPDGDFRPSIWNRGRIVELLPRTGAAMSISGSGDVAGWAIGDDFDQRAFLWRRGVPRWLMDTPSVAMSLNDRGQVVGSMYGPDGARAFLWEERRGRMANRGDSVTDLGTLGGNVSQALGINNRGDVVGWSSTGAGEVRAFVYTNRQMWGLPGLGGDFSRANAITEAGGIVGAATTADGESRAVLWSAGQVMDLNTVLPSGSGWVLHGATGMNAAGQIIGYGAYNDQPSAFILSPR